MERFRAFTHYGDWRGTSAADDSDEASLDQYMNESGLKGEDEFLLAAKLSIVQGSAFVTAFVMPGYTAFAEVQAALPKRNGPVRVRKVELDLTPSEFLELFKQFEVSLNFGRLPLDEKRISIIKPPRRNRK
ncbi:MAG TPA: hypothetical protein VJR23_15230 [Candidatus Acidoferrales bacterium]|nr:hypothetical protein [Candidatus Acidoferrales bacterium]